MMVLHANSGCAETTPLSDLNSPDWAIANIALRRRRDEMDAFKRVEESTPMASNYDIGRAAAQQGYKAPPKADHYVPQQQRDAGFNNFRNAPVQPAPRLVVPNTKKY